jgi:diguanylate cyclase (GGDEF)-like protein
VADTVFSIDTLALQGESAFRTTHGWSSQIGMKPIFQAVSENESQPVVLIADDDGVTRAMVTKWLGRSGYKVIPARDGEEALQLATEYQPDLLLVDVTMPGVDGYDVCRAIQEASAVASPVILLSAHTQTKAQVAGLDAGAVDYIAKPFAEAELIARVRAALRTKAVRDGFAERASRDGLTGLLNRRELDASADGAVALALRHGRALACLMVDLDHFKEINDLHGHAAGDAVLKEVARRISAACRASDVIGRYGGEEFLLLLPETDGPAAVAVGEKLRRALAETPFEVEAVTIAVTGSVGVAAWDEPMMSTASLFAAADEALYRAKELGRNRTELFVPLADRTSA